MDLNLCAPASAWLGIQVSRILTDECYLKNAQKNCHPAKQFQRMTANDQSLMDDDQSLMD